MVSKAYMLERNPPPRSVKRTVDQVLIPAAIDAAAQMEGGLEFVAEAARKRPWATLAAAFGVAWVIGRRA